GSRRGVPWGMITHSEQPRTKARRLRPAERKRPDERPPPKRLPAQRIPQSEYSRRLGTVVALGGTAEASDAAPSLRPLDTRPRLLRRGRVCSPQEESGMPEPDPLTAAIGELVVDEAGALLECSGPATEDEIAAAEKELGVQFPRSYRAFLRQFGAGYLNAYDIFGLPG